MPLRWEQLEQGGEVPLARSSHSITVVGGVAYLWGGEHVPRTPIDSVVHAFDLDARRWSVVQATGSPPTPRVGHTAARVGGCVYIFGGRSAKEVGEGSMNDLHRLDTATCKWAAEPSGELQPPARSFHAMTSDGERYIYVFGGCGEGGRLADLWRYDTQQRAWQQLPGSDKVQARGGAGLAVSASGFLYVIAGFCGEEMDDVHRFDIKEARWDCPACCRRDNQGLPARSVFGVAAHACAACMHSNHLVLYGGEVDPSSQGHDGAGGFSNDTFCFDTDPHGHGWHPLQPEGQKPAPRGWFAASAAEDGSLLIHGGNSATNERLADLHLLRLH